MPFSFASPANPPGKQSTHGFRGRWDSRRHPGRSLGGAGRNYSITVHALRPRTDRQADPPAAVNDAFKEVTAAQQEAESYVNQANAYALQLKQKAQGEATAFDKVYEQYKLAPGVTKRRMYYETMERVLQGVDKTILEAPGVNSYLPLNELRRQPVKEPAQ